MVEAVSHRLAEALRHRLAWPLLTLLLLLAVPWLLSPVPIATLGAVVVSAFEGSAVPHGVELTTEPSGASSRTQSLCRYSGACRSKSGASTLPRSTGLCHAPAR